uniref:Adrenomedullin n=1 Tax=Cynoglossus semilaevis TaxID=244447 RepID=A0A3P8WUR2_CYNSE
MGITVLLLLTVPLTVASPLRSTPMTKAYSVLLIDTVYKHAPGQSRSGNTQEEYVPAHGIVPFHSENYDVDMDALKHNAALKLRRRRTPQRGCKLGTCQLHNLANTLFIFSKTSGKDGSKNANDPQGYGR